MGTAKARELYFTADLLDAQQALGLGLVNRVVPDARLEEETMALASRLARGPRVAYRYMKRNMNAAETGVAQGDARSRGVEPHAHRHDRGSPRGGARLRRKARAPVQGSLELTPRIQEIRAGRRSPREVEHARGQPHDHRERRVGRDLGEPG